MLSTLAAISFVESFLVYKILSSRIFHAFLKNIACGAIYAFTNRIQLAFSGYLVIFLFFTTARQSHFVLRDVSLLINRFNKQSALIIASNCKRAFLNDLF